MPDYFVLKTRPRQEFNIEAELTQLGYGAYCPRFKIRKPPSRYQKTKKKVFITKPLFISYLFIASNALDWFKVKKVKGVLGYISNKGTPLSINESIIELLKKEETFGVNDKHELKLKLGQEIEIIEGLLRGHKGKFKGMKGKDINLDVEAHGGTITATLPIELLKINA